MSSPFIGEIRMVGFNFAPAGWAFCDGSLFRIAENDALFNLIGTTYGGDGQSTFGLPDLRGRAPMHAGSGFVIGQVGGTETGTLTLGRFLPTAMQPRRKTRWEIRRVRPTAFGPTRLSTSLPRGRRRTR